MVVRFSWVLYVNSFCGYDAFVGVMLSFMGVVLSWV